MIDRLRIAATRQSPHRNLAQFTWIVFLRTVYKPHSVRDAVAPLCDHLSGRRVAVPLDATYPGLAFSSHEKARMKTSSLPPSADGFVPTWSCSRRGLPGHPHYCRCRWSFTPPFHHHPDNVPPMAVRCRGCLFLWPSSGRLAPHGGFPAPGAIRRRALWSADFPRPRQRRAAIAQPT